ADAEQARSDERAADGAEPADGNHDQDVDEIGEGKCVIEADDLDGKRAAEARKPAAERKSDGQDPVDVDAQPARHPLVVDRRARVWGCWAPGARPGGPRGVYSAPATGAAVIPIDPPIRNSRYTPRLWPQTETLPRRYDGRFSGCWMVPKI